jgi:hypothetical protein
MGITKTNSSFGALSSHCAVHAVQSCISKAVSNSKFPPRSSISINPSDATFYSQDVLFISYPRQPALDPHPHRRCKIDRRPI